MYERDYREREREGYRKIVDVMSEKCLKMDWCGML